MSNKEYRMRCIEAIAQTGVREPRRIVVDADQLLEWVCAEDKADDEAPKRGRPKAADKA